MARPYGRRLRVVPRRVVAGDRDPYHRRAVGVDRDRFAVSLGRPAGDFTAGGLTIAATSRHPAAELRSLPARLAPTGRLVSTLDDRVAARLAASAVVRMARPVTGDVGRASGASVYFDSSPLPRLQRDVEVLEGHVVFDWDRTPELAGRIMLGFGPGPTDTI